MLSKMMFSVDDRNKVIASSQLLRCQLTFSCVCRSVVIGVHKSSFHWCRCENNHSIQPWISLHAKTSANHQGVSLITSQDSAFSHQCSLLWQWSNSPDLNPVHYKLLGVLQKQITSRISFYQIWHE